MTLAAQDYPAPAPGARAFRDALGRFATGVAFLTAVPDGEPAGLIVNSHPPSHVTTFEVLCRAAKRGRGPREASGWGERLVSRCQMSSRLVWTHRQPPAGVEPDHPGP
jgi:hypothetical protein